MKKVDRGPALVIGLLLGAFSVSCVAYKIKDLDAKALAAKGRRAAVLGVQTETESIQFTEAEPGRIRDGAIVGKVPGGVVITPYDIADIGRARKRARIVLKEGSRFDVLSSWREGDNIHCEVLTPICIPLDGVLRARVRIVNTAATVLRTLAGAAIAVAFIALDSSATDEDADFVDGEDSSLLASLIDGLLETDEFPDPPRSVKSLKDLEGSPDVSGETEFWVLEWTAVKVTPGPDGRYRVPLGGGARAARGVDEVKLVLADHPPGLVIVPDVQGILRTLKAPVAPDNAVDGSVRDVGPFLEAIDGELWRSPGGDLQTGTAAEPHDTLILEFPRPAGTRRAKLVVNATNTMWRSQFARQSLGPADGPGQAGKSRPVHDNWEFTKLGVEMETVFGWQTAQMIFGGGPLAFGDMVYGLDLGDVRGNKVRIRFRPPAGYWLIDRLALDTSEDEPITEILLDAEAVQTADGPSGAEALQALDKEDGTTLFLESPDSQPILVFSAPPPAEGIERTLFLRTVSCYEMPPRPGQRG